MADVFPVEEGSGELTVVDLTGALQPIQPPEGMGVLVFRKIVSAIHTLYLHTGNVPSFDDVLQQYPGIRKADLFECWQHESLTQALQYRGVHWGNDTGLSLAQEHLLMALSDPTDRRSQTAILRSHGISGTVFRTWMKHLPFSDRLHKSTVDAYTEYLPLVRTAFIREAMDGKPQAVELLFKMTGEYNPETEAVGDLREIVKTLVASVIRNVTDETAKRAILQDAEAVVSSLRISSPRALER